MTRYKIVADSAANILQLKQVDFATVPLCIQADQAQYLDDAQLDVDKMITDLQNYTGKTTTACPNIHQWCEAFSGADIVFAVTLTSALSGSYSSALQAKEIYQEEHPDVKICVLDSLAAGPKMVLMIEKLEELILKETPFEEIVTILNEYQTKTKLIFSLESLVNLVNNGRINSTTAKVAHLLKIRMIGSASLEGKLEPLGKARGEKKTLAMLVEKLTEFGFKGGKVVLAHCQNQAGATKLQEMILEVYPTSQITITKCRGLCSYYAEQGGLMIGFEI
ncbi:DegV family protein [Ligilactobacillus sp. Marseille-Q7487]|uniref:DegV family protein n=1 Tax=Ligilactobacillus sp. Marseille-Q7487 TaxID=3022128 RepID=UPI0024A8AE9D|nr:DegV family protein [Ligilactobacillus sp. Marseille-Q7487]